MGGLDPLERGDQERDRLGRTEDASAHVLAEVLALEQLHDEKDRALVIPDVEDVDHVRVRERAEGERLALHAAAELRLVREEQLDRDPATGADVTPGIDRPHPPCPSSRSTRYRPPIKLPGGSSGTFGACSVISLRLCAPSSHSRSRQR